MSPPSKVLSSKLPFIFVNMAMTADGKIATSNRAVSSFGSPHDHRHLLELRATADAVMAGARTTDVAPINLGPGPAEYRRRRLDNGLSEYNLRVIASGKGSINPNAEVFKHRFSPIIILTTSQMPKARRLRLRALVDEVKVCGRREIDFRRAFCWLRNKWGVNRLLCEGGGGLNDALFRADLVDELHLTICPKIFGGRNAPTVADGRGFQRLSNALPLQLKSFKRIENEFFAVSQRVPRR
jgi:2,5-diamino-6-(ribosylamino)-4(3H)-pyrimidinone 5'-phosphate reductase